VGTKIIDEPKLILDAGTGTGIIALIMAHAYPNSKITAIDIGNEAIQLANNNFKNSSW
jgi:tRNA1Val (adenine37-N6)-methyltransferase